MENRLTTKEAEELERFRKRREAFGGDLSVKNVHNVSIMFPIMYSKIFRTNNLRTDLFCTNSPAYSDADEEIVTMYEKCLTDGYEVRMKEDA